MRDFSCTLSADMNADQDTLIRGTVRHSDLLRRLCMDAGNAVMEVYSSDFHVDLKDDQSPLTLADRAAHDIIEAGLRALPSPLGGLPVLSEEGGIPDYSRRKGWPAWWLVDPLDGTREFVNRNGEFTVNIALVIRPGGTGAGLPAAGWVYAPVTGVLYEGISGSGSRRFTPARAGEKGIADLVKGDKLPGEAACRPPRIVASRSHRTPETDLVISAVSKLTGTGSIVSSGSSLKLCRIAEGSAELYPRPGPTMEWDTAAADAVCRASGARVAQALNGRPLEYGKENLLNPWFVVSRDSRLIDITVQTLRAAEAVS
jgi:3'(2'), 5'-bisphosphate nucleotidase